MEVGYFPSKVVMDTKLIPLWKELEFGIYLLKKFDFWSSHHGSMETNLTSRPEDAGLIPGLTQWVKDLCFHELWCRSQIWLGSCFTVAVV